MIGSFFGLDNNVWQVFALDVYYMVILDSLVL